MNRASHLQEISFLERILQVDDLQPPSRPHFSLFTREQCEAIHYASLEILRRTGVRVDHARALALLKETDVVITDGNLVRFPPALVEWAPAQAPSRIALCKRGSSEVAIRMEGREVAFGTGSACPNYLDPRTAPSQKLTPSPASGWLRRCPSWTSACPWDCPLT